MFFYDMFIGSTVYCIFTDKIVTVTTLYGNCTVYKVHIVIALNSDKFSTYMRSNAINLAFTNKVARTVS